jgi:nucleoside-diphosphate-sugar epimerase
VSDGIKGGACAVTGTSGYLGSRLSTALADRGWTVYRLSRRAGVSQPVEDGDRLGVPFTLADGPPDGFFEREKITALVHCAYDFRLVTWPDIHRTNVRGSIRLMERARAAGVDRIVVISTISAFEGCRSLYGRAKLEIEKEALRLGATVVRPGLIYGENPGAMVQALTKAATTLPLVPLIGNGRQRQYLVHEEDLAALVDRLLADDRPAVSVSIIAANEDPFTFREILTMLAAAKGRRARFVPVPWRFFWVLLKAAEAVGLRPRFRSDSVVSLVNQDPQPDFAPARATGVRFRTFTATAIGSDR